jgi:hypothetical protein
MGLFDTIGGLLTGKTKVKTPTLPTIGASLGSTNKVPSTAPAGSGAGALGAVLGPIGGPIASYLVNQYVANKPQATNTAAQSAQLAKKPLQTNAIAPQTAIPNPEANSQGLGNASISARTYQPLDPNNPNIPGPPTIFNQDDRETNPYYAQAKAGYDANIKQINGLYNDSVAGLSNSQADADLERAQTLQMNNQLNSEVISADNEYKNRLQTLQDQLSEMQRTVAQQNRAATVAKQADYDKQASKIAQALTSRGVGQLEIDRQLRELKDEIFAPVVAQSAQQNQALNEARTQLMASTRSLMEANDSQKASIRNKYTSAIQSIKQERGISDSKKQESIMNLRAKLIDDLRATEQNFVNQQNTLQTQYNNAENRALTAADMIGVLNGLNTVRRDTLNESARKTDMGYAEGQQKLALAAAKLAARRGTGAGSVSQADAADLVQQAMQIQALDPSTTFEQAMDLVANRLKKGTVGDFFGQGIDALLGQKVKSGTIPAAPASFNNQINPPKASDDTQWLKDIGASIIASKQAK